MTSRYRHRRCPRRQGCGRASHRLCSSRRRRLRARCLRRGRMPLLQSSLPRSPFIGEGFEQRACRGVDESIPSVERDQVGRRRADLHPPAPARPSNVVHSLARARSMTIRSSPCRRLRHALMVSSPLSAAAIAAAPPQTARRAAPSAIVCRVMSLLHRLRRGAVPAGDIQPSGRSGRSRNQRPGQAAV